MEPTVSWKLAYPIRKTSASFNKEALMRIGNGYFSNSFGNRTMDSHCSPTFPDRKPTKESDVKLIYCMLVY